jgi:putative membrane protein
MFHLLIRWLTNALALIITAILVPGIFLAGPATAFGAALLLGLINTLIRPILSFFSLPLQFLTLGLFTLVLNGLMLALTAYFIPGFQIVSFFSALLGSIVLSLISMFLTHVFK